jgi:hypothetical protein
MITAATTSTTTKRSREKGANEHKKGRKKKKGAETQYDRGEHLRVKKSQKEGERVRERRRERKVEEQPSSTAPSCSLASVCLLFSRLNNKGSCNVNHALNHSSPVE